MSPRHLEYMALPRMAALAEVLWTPKEMRNEADFISRLIPEMEMLKSMNTNVARSLYQVDVKPTQGKQPGTISIALNSAMPGTIARSCQCIFKPEPNDMTNGYSTLSGDDRCDMEAKRRVTECTREPMEYSSPFTIDRDLRMTAYFKKGESTFTSVQRTFNFNLTTAHPINLSVQPNEWYNEGGAFTLVDDISAQEKRVNTADGVKV